jgi:hypothetical protein
MTHGRGSEGENWGMEWVARTLHTTSEHCVSSITTADEHNSAASSRLKLTPHAGLNGLVPLAERRILVSARVPSHSKRSLLILASRRKLNVFINSIQLLISHFIWNIVIRRKLCSSGLLLSVVVATPYRRFGTTHQSRNVGKKLSLRIV